MGKLRMRIAGSVAVAAALFVGCGGASTDGASGPIPKDQLATRFASAVCNSLGPCCQTDGFAFDVATCLKNAEAGFAQDIAKMNGPTIRYDEAAGGACVDAYAAVIRSCAKDSGNLVDTACANVFTGTLPEGATCASSRECASPQGGDASCEKTVNPGTGVIATTGTCKQMTGGVTITGVHGKAGEACAGDCTTTATGSSCSFGSTSGTSATGTAICYHEDGLYCPNPAHVCTALAPVGQSCSSGGCVTGAFCDTDVCAPQRDTGSCMGASDACSASSYCDFTSSQCLPRHSNGTPCTDSSSCQSSHCEHPASSTTPTGTGDGGVGGSGGGPSSLSGICAKRTFTTADACMGVGVGLN